MLKGFTHARLACGCRVGFRSGVEGSPVTVVIDEKVVGIVLEYLKSDEFREELNHRVPPPEKGESEQEFVERANAAIKAILDERYLRGGGGPRSGSRRC